MVQEMNWKRREDWLLACGIGLIKLALLTNLGDALEVIWGEGRIIVYIESWALPLALTWACSKSQERPDE